MAKGQVTRWRHHFIEDAFGFDANSEFVFERLQMDVGSVVLDGEQQNQVQEFADRNAIGESLGAIQVEWSVSPDGPRRFGQLFVVRQRGDEFLDAFALRRIVAFDRCFQFAFGRHPHFDVVTEERSQLILRFDRFCGSQVATVNLFPSNLTGTTRYS